MTYQMLDDANVGEFAGLGSPYVFGGYVDNYITFPWLEANRPHDRLVSITLHGNDADVLDIETGGATIYMAPAWVRRAETRSLRTSRPVLYCPAGTAWSLIGEMNRSGIARSRYLLWSAHIGISTEHICGPGRCPYPQADGTQNTWTYLGRNLDHSLLSNQFFGSGPGPGPSGVTYLEDDVAYVPTVSKAGDTVPLSLPIGTNFVVFSSYDEVDLTVWQHSKKGGVDKFRLDSKGAYTVKVDKGNRQLFVVRRNNPNVIVSAAPSKV